ncbi:Scavenger receptor cysteine-rich type 1 M130, partial [Paramuricea clavata]
MADGRLFVSSDAELSDVEENTTKNVESKRANNINVVKYLNITEKGKLRWTGSFENLEILMNELLETQTKWSSPGGHSDKETELSNAFVSEGNGDREGDGVNTASTENSHIEINLHETSNYNKVLDSIRDLELCFVNKFDELLQEIRQSKTTEETISEDRNSLIKENGKLKQEIDILSDQVNNYKCIASDLHTKVKQLEDEQKSLITAIKIVQNYCNTNKQSTWSWNVVKNRKPNQNESTQRGQNSGENSHNGLAKADNQYSVLVDESDDEINIPKNRNQSEPPRHTIRSSEDKRRNYSAPRKQQADNDRNNNNNERAQDSRRSPRVGQSRVAILGDSMLKQINARRIQQGMKHKIVVKTFAGAGIKEMNHYVKPTLLTAPNKLSLHVGTNDLQRMTPDELLTHVQKLGESITRENGNIDLILSEIITRNDDKTLADK